MRDGGETRDTVALEPEDVLRLQILNHVPLVVLDIDTGAEQVLAPGEHLPLAR